MISARLSGSVLLAAAMLTLPGCLQRTISITTEPPGATVWLNDVEVGTTPLETDFTYYGAYDVRIRRAGYEPILDRRKITPPLHERPVIDLFAEMIPAKISNRIEWTFAMKPADESAQPAGLGADASDAAAVERAKDLRGKLIAAPIVPAAPGTPAEATR